MNIEEKQENGSEYTIWKWQLRSKLNLHLTKCHRDLTIDLFSFGFERTFRYMKRFPRSWPNHMVRFKKGNHRGPILLLTKNYIHNNNQFRTNLLPVVLRLVETYLKTNVELRFCHYTKYDMYCWIIFDVVTTLPRSTLIFNSSTISVRRYDGILLLSFFPSYSYWH